MNKENNNSIIITDRNLTKEEQNSILERGDMDLSEFFDNFQYLCFVLDGSGSMFSRIHDTDQLSKVELERRVIRKYVDEKIGEKALTMKVGIVEFDNRAQIHLRGSSDLDEIKRGINEIGHSGGGTQISKGMRAALTLLKKTKKWIPRIVLTSDGDVFDLSEAIDAAHQAKAAGVVIDTIYIGSGKDLDRYHAQNLARLSAITGGVHEEITGEADFEIKFLKVAGRKLLNAAE